MRGVCFNFVEACGFQAALGGDFLALFNAVQARFVAGFGFGVVRGVVVVAVGASGGGGNG